MRSPIKKIVALATIGLTSLSLAACGNSEPASESTDSTAAASTDEGWPRTIDHEMGELELEAKPERIVSTSVSVTGTLLAIDAPVVASAATGVSPITDDKGFFAQWSDVADERGVDVLYDNLEFNMEALIAADPDLVIISTSGADTVADEYDQIAEQFPTIAVDYSKQTWQELATELGADTGNEEGAQAAIDDFDDYAADAASKITVPEGGASIVSYNGPSQEQAIGKQTGPHAQLMSALGFDVIEGPDELDTTDQERDDFIFITYENLTKGIEGESVFLLTGTEDTVDSFLSDSTLANLPAVQSEQVYPLGINSFRIDYYSGKELVDSVVDSLS